MFPALGNFIEDLGPKTQNKRGSLDYYTMNSFCYTWRKTKTCVFFFFLIEEKYILETEETFGFQTHFGK